MADKARQQTDKRLAEMEKYLTSIYRESAKGIYEKWNEFMSEANDKLSKLQKEYDDAKATGDKALIKKQVSNYQGRKKMLRCTMTITRLCLMKRHGNWHTLTKQRLHILTDNYQRFTQSITMRLHQKRYQSE